MNNFEGMAAITSVFSAAPIQRLKPVWSAVGSKVNILNSFELSPPPPFSPSLLIYFVPFFSLDGEKSKKIGGIVATSEELQGLSQCF